MKKIIPFKKNIKFDNNIYEITSISLEHTLHKEENTISGNFIISGEYRVTENSVDTLPFNESLPFTIELTNKYNINNAQIDINDFYYEIVDNKILGINIEVKIDKIEEIIEEPKEIIEVINNPVEEPVNIRCIEEEPKEIIEENSIFANIDNQNNYVNYRVYIVRENDTLESIMNDYQVTKEEIEQYNDISSIKIGDKIIIPYVKYQ